MAPVTYRTTLECTAHADKMLMGASKTAYSGCVYMFPSVDVKKICRSGAFAAVACRSAHDQLCGKRCCKALVCVLQAQATSPSAGLLYQQALGQPCLEPMPTLRLPLVQTQVSL